MGVGGVGATMQDIENVIRGAKTPATNHHRAISECVQSFAWVTLDPASGVPHLTPSACATVTVTPDSQQPLRC